MKTKAKKNYPLKHEERSPDTTSDDVITDDSDPPELAKSYSSNEARQSHSRAVRGHQEEVRRGHAAQHHRARAQSPQPAAPIL
jgi:hypothetical protein